MLDNGGNFFDQAAKNRKDIRKSKKITLDQGNNYTTAPESVIAQREENFKIITTHLRK